LGRPRKFNHQNPESFLHCIPPPSPSNLPNEQALGGTPENKCLLPTCAAVRLSSPSGALSWIAKSTCAAPCSSRAARPSGASAALHTTCITQPALHTTFRGLCSGAHYLHHTTDRGCTPPIHTRRRSHAHTSCIAAASNVSRCPTLSCHSKQHWQVGITQQLQYQQVPSPQLLQ
jgi:hypothetical protein